jgi:hypothetical protein
MNTLHERAHTEQLSNLSRRHWLPEKTTVWQLTVLCDWNRSGH